MGDLKREDLPEKEQEMDRRVHEIYRRCINICKEENVTWAIFITKDLGENTSGKGALSMGGNVKEIEGLCGLLAGAITENPVIMMGTMMEINSRTNDRPDEASKMPWE